jgi:hypothetical protein
MFLSKARLKASEMVEQAVEFLVSKYEQAANVFTPASPFGQLLLTISNISELIFSYISHTAEELNIATAQNVESIHGLARLTGHDAWRGGSAYGVMQVRLNGSNMHEIKGDYVTVKNFTKFTIAETGVQYFINLPGDYVRISKSDTTPVTINYMQGETDSQTFTSDGTPLQTFNPVVKSMTDNDNVSVTVNGKEWRKVESLYDMPADDGYDDSCECYMVKSSVNVGLTVVFGNGRFGRIPPSGSEIEVIYIKTSGSAGNAGSTDLTFEFLDTGTDGFGNEVGLNEVLLVKSVTPPSMGSDYEDPEFTRLIAPKTSRSFVLATPENYVSFLSRYNQFSFVDAYTTKDDGNIGDDNIVYVRLIPNLKKKISSGTDYFSLPESEFRLSDGEKDGVIRALDDSGQMLISSEVRIVDPEIRRFAINVIIRYFEAADKTAIRSGIRDVFSRYFLNINRKDIIPLSDLISIVEGVSGVDTCDVFFTTEENENAIRYGYYTTTRQRWNRSALLYEAVETRVDVPSGEDPNVGMDGFGNIVVPENCMYVPKGGWRDRNGNWYTETPETGKLGPLNIFFTDEVDGSIYNQTMQKRFAKLMNKQDI